LVLTNTSLNVSNHLAPCLELGDVVVAAEEGEGPTLATDLAHWLHVGGQILVHDVSHGEPLRGEALVSSLGLQLESREMR
jgi:hypothetical protein